MRTLRPLLATLALAACGARSPEWTPDPFRVTLVQSQICIVDPTGGPPSFDTNPSGNFRNAGVLDVAVARTYVLHPLFAAASLGPAHVDVLATERLGMGPQYVDDVTAVPVESVHVHLSATGAGVLPDVALDYDVPVNLPVPLGSPGYAQAPVTLIPEALGDALYTQFCGAVAVTPTTHGCRSVRPRQNPMTVIVQVTPVAHIHDVPALTSVYRHALTVCCGCLAGQDSNDSRAGQPQPNCNVPTPVPYSDATLGFPTQVCSLGQDETFSCSLCAATNLWCQPVCPGTP